MFYWFFIDVLLHIDLIDPYFDILMFVLLVFHLISLTKLL
jgi:hypothetical protein